MIKKVYLLLTAMFVIASMANAQGGPPKSELGSKDNPYYTKTDDQISLRQYFDTRHKDLEDKIFQKFESLKEAVDVAKKSTDAQLASMNEFRATLKDQAGTFVTRTELLAAVGFLAALMFGLLQFMKKKE